MKIYSKPHQIALLKKIIGVECKKSRGMQLVKPKSRCPIPLGKSCISVTCNIV